MKATEFKIKVTDTKTKDSIIIRLSDLGTSEEVEDRGVFVDTSNGCKVNPSNWVWCKETNVPRYADTDINWESLDFEYVP